MDTITAPQHVFYKEISEKRKRRGGTNIVRVVIVGASYGTLAAALSLRRALPAADITFVNRTRAFLPQRFVPDLLAARFPEHEEHVALAAVCESKGIRFREADVTEIDGTQRIIVLNGVERLSMDCLLIDLPHEAHSADVPGAEFAFSLSGVSSAKAIRTHLVHELTRARDTNRAEHRTAIVVGAGVTGIEAVCSVRELATQLSEEYYLFPDELEHIIIDGHAVPDPVPDAIKRKLAMLLEENGIEWYDKPVERFSSTSVVLGDRELETETIIWTATPKGNRLFRNAQLPLDDHGFLAVDEYLRATPWLFAIGQSIRTLNTLTLTERSGIALVAEGVAAARSIVASVEQKPMPRYRPQVETNRVIALTKGSGFGWFGPFTCHGALPARRRMANERAHAHAAQKA